MNIGKSAIAFVLGQIAFSSPALAGDFLTVSDASLIEFVVHTDDKVYLRNLSSFDPTWQGCCYSYWIDLTTEHGKAQFATFLTRNASHSRIDFYISSKAAGGHFDHVGDF